MSQNINSAVAVIGIDIGKNSFNSRGRGLHEIRPPKFACRYIPDVARFCVGSISSGHRRPV